MSRRQMTQGRHRCPRFLPQYTWPPVHRLQPRTAAAAGSRTPWNTGGSRPWAAVCPGPARSLAFGRGKSSQEIGALKFNPEFLSTPPPPPSLSLSLSLYLTAALFEHAANCCIVSKVHYLGTRLSSCNGSPYAPLLPPALPPATGADSWVSNRVNMGEGEDTEI